MVLESTLFAPLQNYYENKECTVFSEVPMLSRKIDLVSVNSDLSEIIAVEIKVNKWKNALQQALAYRIAADKVYVAIWYEYIHRVPIDLFNKFGIGLLSVNGVVEKKLEAQKSRNKHPKIALELKSNMLNLNNSNEEL